MKRDRSAELFERARAFLVGGVNSPVRAFRSVGGNPIIIERAKGSKIYDVDGNEYIDYVASWGAIIHGHADDDILSAIMEASYKGTTFGFTNTYEIELAEEISKRVPSAEMVRLVNSGTEAAMTALRLLRGFTNRNKVIKFVGNYHGHFDPFLVKAGSGLATYSLPTSAGTTRGCVMDTILVDYNDTEGLIKAAKQNRDDLAGIIVEPIAGNMGVVKPKDGFLRLLRETCDSLGCVLVFDEVITGFRVSYGGAQELYGVTPDLTLFGKVVGGGMPLAAVAGRKDIMSKLAPEGPVYQAGTLAGNPVAAAAGLAAIRKLTRDKYDKLESYGARLEHGMSKIMESYGIKGVINRVGSMMSVFFGTEKVERYSDIKVPEKFANFFWKMLDSGVLIPPSAFESMFFTLAHTDSDLRITLEAFEKSLQALVT
ncbi:MAG: glutamate-1-semialdehyde 2,1-aminomutase [Nitrososphaeria archaeon]